MRFLGFFVLAIFSLCIVPLTQAEEKAAGAAIYDIPLRTIDGKAQTLAAFKGRVLVIVNTASRCGFTPQYRDLEALYERYSEKGLVVLGFPSNDFQQEDGTNEEIKTFCKVRFGVTFPLFEKGSVKGDGMQPLYKALFANAPSDLKGEIGWNFEKIVVDKSGVVRGRFGSVVNPMNARVTDLIDSLLTP
jgi:glutathione peroxidase